MSSDIFKSWKPGAGAGFVSEPRSTLATPSNRVTIADVVKEPEEETSQDNFEISTSSQPEQTMVTPKETVLPIDVGVSTNVSLEVIFEALAVPETIAMTVTGIGTKRLSLDQLPENAANVIIKKFLDNFYSATGKQNPWTRGGSAAASVVTSLDPGDKNKNFQQPG